jgi:hypothetical protein
MSLRRSTPLAVHPRGICDALDSSQIFTGAMTALKDLIPDPSTRGLWQCRPASVLAADLGSAVPGPVGVVSAEIIIGDIVYGMIGGASNLDYPFAYDLKTNVFIPISGASSGNLPATQVTSGDWVPPTMDVIGSTILVTHPGFAGTSNWLGTIDISSVPTSAIWSAGNLTGAGGILFSAATGVPVAVKAFNGRAWWAYNPPSGPVATVFSDQLAPTTVTNAAAVQVVTYDDNVSITALGVLPLSNQLGGIIQALLIFKGVTNIFQITGDIELGPGPPLGTLNKNSLNVATGTFAPNSLASTPKGLAFAAPDGIRIIDFNAQVSDPIGNEGMGKTLPFLFAVAPSRMAAAANGTLYRISVQDGSLGSSPFVEYWLDLSRGGVWSGPHTFPARTIKPYKTTFVMAPQNADGKLFQSDHRQTSSSTFTENNVAMSFGWLTTFFPDTDQMCENALIESTVYVSMAPDTTYVVQALNEANSVLRSCSLTSAQASVLWGNFNWGQATWGGVPSALYPQLLAWDKPVVFRRMALNIMGLSSQQFRIGTLHMRYEQLGYLQQPLGTAA